ncbi:hypothetical protein [Actinoplanes sp. CA-252034]|uniref:hypothetical protein n=1 Tax=Actinoplanes sp. CA-252034 TaxID=3239906 RepID=UPI003D961D6F
MDQRHADLARALRELGWWRHLSPDDAAAGERAVAEGSHPLGGRATLDEEPGTRYFDVDGETMAEGGVTRVLREMAPALRPHGVDLHVELVSHPEDYVVAINGRRCVVLTPDDWDRRSPWAVATMNPLIVVNELLAEAGAVPRLYTWYPGSNQGEAWLLDPRIVAVIADSGLISADDMPVRPFSAPSLR